MDKFLSSSQPTYVKDYFLLVQKLFCIKMTSNKFHAFIPFEGILEEVLISMPHHCNTGEATVMPSTSSVFAALHHHQISSDNSKVDCTRHDGHLPFQLLESTLTGETTTATQDKDWEHLISELDIIGWQRIEDIADDMQSFCVRSECSRHVFKCCIPAGYPATAPSYEALLPVPLQIKSHKLSECVAEWDRQLLQLAPFFELMAELDSSVLVLDPRTPQPHHTHRRLMFENQVCVEVTVSPTSALAPPHCRFIGPSDLTAPLHSRLADLYQRWDSNEGLVQNLEVLLQERLVRSGACAPHSLLPISSEALEEAECVMCYCFQSEEGQLPDLVCDHCRHCMHHSCLYRFLSGLTSSRQSMQLICGECPFCSKPISCKVPV